MVCIRKQFDPQYDSNDYATHLESGSAVQQHLKDTCDVNKILAKWMKTGTLEHIKDRQPIYADVSNMDFKTALDTVNRAEDAFQALPASLRRKMDNDPANFVEWMSDPEIDSDVKREFGLIVDAEPKHEPKQSEGDNKGDADVQ